MGLPRPSHPLLLLVLLPAAASCLEGFCPLPCRCQGRLLDCRHAALATVPPATRRQALFILDFTSNSISSIEKQSWREYPWAEFLVLQQNNLQVVKRNSLEGLLLLKHLDLSFNKILSLEERAFEPLPFLQLINLHGNFITQIQNGTFQAWHGMQFLQQLTLSHNPLAVIADTSFFKLPSIKYLNLGETRVTQQTFLRLLQTTFHLETLKLSGNVACCLCQENHITETPCRTIKFHCDKLCSTSAPQCDPLPETQGETMEVLQSGKLNASTTLNFSPRETLLRDHEIVTLGVDLSVSSTDSDLSNPSDDNSRTNSYSPQHLSRQEGKTSKELRLMLHRIQHTHRTAETDISKLYFLEKALMARLKKLHKSKIIVTVQNTISPLPGPAVQVQRVWEIPAMKRGTARGWVQKRRDVGLNPAAPNPWEAAGRLNPKDNPLVFRQYKISTSPSKNSLSLSPAEAPPLPRSFESHSDTMEQTRKTPGTEDVEKVEGAEEALSLRQDYVWTSRKQKQGDSPYLNTNNHLFFKMVGNVNPEEEPTLTEGKAEQRLNTNQYFLNNLLVNSSPTASSTLEDTAEEEGPSLHGYFPAIPPTTETHWKRRKEESSFLNNSGGSDSLDNELLRGDLFESEVNRRLRLLVPNKGLRAFIAQVARALRMDCHQPKLQVSCAKMISKTGLLIKLFSERQDDQGASALMEQCLLAQNVSNSTALAKETGVKITELEGEHTLANRTLLAMLVAVLIMTVLMVVCLFEVCSQKCTGVFQSQSTHQSQPRRHYQKPQPRGRRRKDGARKQGPPEPAWLRDLHQPLTSQQEQALAQLRDWNTEEEEEEIFNKAQLR